MSKQISPSEYAERSDILEQPTPGYRPQSYNTRLQKIKILKDVLKQKIDAFDAKSDNYLKGQAYTDD